jgi:DeoR family fructose operon transcriptional repressor
LFLAADAFPILIITPKFTLIKPNESIFLDGGSTVLALARLLTEMHRITVVTNSLRVAHALSGTGPRLIMIGGELRRLSQTFVGPTTAPCLEQVCIDTAFMGTIGLTESEGLTTTDPAEAFTKKMTIQRARQVALLADHTKLGKISFAKFGTIDDLDILVTDSKANIHFLGTIKKKGVKLLQ